MEDQELTYQKSRQRRAGIAARQSVAAALRRASDCRICAFLLESDAYRAAQTILLYAAAGGEVDLTEFAVQARWEGKTLCYPRCLPGRQMDALQPLGPDSWEEGAYHILAPIPARSRRVSPEELELILVPCAAFDPSCRRVGVGAATMTNSCPCAPAPSPSAWPTTARRYPRCTPGSWTWGWTASSPSCAGITGIDATRYDYTRRIFPWKQ
ncbi:MAG: 5-formyltetrahydrofolate cyclo-ligase [Clostridiales bacterium]|nr:5-formyltetrahydrofolate cyclo-ligase [Clostridiales bacterium]